MSTVAFRGGWFASDSQVSNDTLIIGTCSEKVGVIGRYAYGFVGALADLAKIKEWLKVGGPSNLGVSLPELRGNSSEALICCFDEHGPVEVQVGDGVRQSSIFYLSPAGIFKNLLFHRFHALGSGSELALGAMAAGASPAEAVTIACEYDGYSSLPVHVVGLPL